MKKFLSAVLVTVALAFGSSDAAAGVICPAEKKTWVGEFTDRRPVTVTLIFRQGLGCIMTFDWGSLDGDEAGSRIDNAFVEGGNEFVLYMNHRTSRVSLQPKSPGKAEIVWVRGSQRFTGMLKEKTSN